MTKEQEKTFNQETIEAVKAYLEARGRQEMADCELGKAQKKYQDAAYYYNDCLEQCMYEVDEYSKDINEVYQHGWMTSNELQTIEDAVYELEEAVASWGRAKAKLDKIEKEVDESYEAMMTTLRKDPTTKDLATLEKAMVQAMVQAKVVA